MSWILWREYRLNRLILVAGAVLTLLPYVIALVVLVWITRPLVTAKVTKAPDLAMVIGSAAVYSILLGNITLAFLGGNAVSGERADRSAEFMAYLPVTRGRRLLSKVVLALGTMIAVWGVNILVLLVVLSRYPVSEPVEQHELPMLFFWAVTTLVFYGVGWLVSSLQSSSAFAVVSGLISPMLIVMGLQAAAWVQSVPGDSRFLAPGYVLMATLLGTLSFAVGAVYYLRRVEP